MKRNKASEVISVLEMTSPSYVGPLYSIFL